MGIDLETTGLFPWMGAKIDLIAIKNENGDSYILEANQYEKEELTLLFFELSKVLVIGQNIKFDCNFILYQYGVLLSRIFCTQIAAQILDNGRQKELKFDLISIISRYLGSAYAISKVEKKALQKSFINPIVRKYLSQMPSMRQKQILYAAEDVEHLIRLYHVLKEALERNDLLTISKLEYAVLPVLSKMEVRGIRINRTEWTILAQVWEKELINIEQKLDEESLRLLNGKKSEFRFSEGRRPTTTSFDLFGFAYTSNESSESCINYGSADQVGQLWKEFGEEPPTDDGGAYTLGEDAIATYLTESPSTNLSRFIRLLLDYREVAKLISTYGVSFLDLLDKDSCIHTSYTQTRTETGRLSSKEPNLQNIPANKDPHRDVRRFFIARPGYKLITCDMAGAEIAIAADYSGEPLLLDALKNGTDMHSQLASVSFSIIFGREIIVSKSKETIEIDGYTYTLSDLRDVHKSVTFAKFYKAGARRVYQTLAEFINRHHKPEQRLAIAGMVSEALDKRMPRLSKYLSDIIEEAKTTGFLLADKLGRRRFFPPTVYGEGANYQIQSTNASALKIALIKIDKYLSEGGMGSILLNVHDEVLVEVQEDVVENAAIKIKEIMAQSLSYFLEKIKADASVSIGYYWKK